MIELLNKYYEFFLKKNFQDKDSIDDDSEFIELYHLVINQCDLSKNSQIKTDIKEFFEFFGSIRGYRSGKYFSNLPCIKRDLKEVFEKDSKASFEWFNATKFIIKNDEFLFSRSFTKKRFCKVYISIKPEKYVETLIKIQGFIDALYKNHHGEEIGQCKFRNVPANDAIVMRFSCVEHYNEFIDFLNKNEDIKASFDAPNPFIPQDENGLSVISDNGGSYNYFVTRMIWDYMFFCRENKINVSIDGIASFINNYDCSNDRMLMENGDKVMNDYKSILTGKMLSKPDNELLNIVSDKVKPLTLIRK